MRRACGRGHEYKAPAAAGASAPPQGLGIVVPVISLLITPPIFQASRVVEPSLNRSCSSFDMCSRLMTVVPARCRPLEAIDQLVGARHTFFGTRLCTRSDTRPRKARLKIEISRARAPLVMAHKEIMALLGLALEGGDGAAHRFIAERMVLTTPSLPPSSPAAHSTEWRRSA